MITLQLIRNQDKYCNYCDRTRELEQADLHDVDFYELKNKDCAGIVTQLCEFCVRDLKLQVEGIDD